MRKVKASALILSLALCAGMLSACSSTNQFETQPTEAQIIDTTGLVPYNLGDTGYMMCFNEAYEVIDSKPNRKDITPSLTLYAEGLNNEYVEVYTWKLSEESLEDRLNLDSSAIGELTKNTYTASNGLEVTYTATAMTKESKEYNITSNYFEAGEWGVCVVYLSYLDLTDSIANMQAELSTVAEGITE